MTARTKRLLAIAAVAIPSALYGVWPWIAPQLIFMPPPGPPQAYDVAPEAQPFAIAAAPDVTLRGVYLPSKGSSTCGLVIYHYGNASSVARAARTLRRLTTVGFAVAAVDYRGYGGSEGHPTEGAVTSDALVVFDWLREHKGSDQPLVVMGHSMGSAVAAHVAARRGVSAVVLLAPFTSLEGATSTRLPWAPRRLVSWGGVSFSSLDNVRIIGAPKLFLVAEEDPFIPRLDARKLYAAATTPKELRIIPTSHNGLLHHRATWEAIPAFLTENRICGATVSTK